MPILLLLALSVSQVSGSEAPATALISTAVTAGELADESVTKETATEDESMHAPTPSEAAAQMIDGVSLGVEHYTSPPAGAVCGCCCDSLSMIDHTCFGGRVGASTSVVVGGLILGAIVGCGGGLLLGIIPAVIFGALSFGLSISGGATTSGSATAAQAAFILTDIVAGLIGMLIGTIAGGGLGLLFAGPILAGVVPPPDQGHRRRRRAPHRRRRYYSELPPAPPVANSASIRF